MAKILDPAPRVQAGRLRVFGSRAEAIDYADSTTPQWRPMICIVERKLDGLLDQWLHWFHVRPLHVAPTYIEVETYHGLGGMKISRTVH